MLRKAINETNQPNIMTQPISQEFQNEDLIDFIGDIHGHAERLKGLLDRLGYQVIDGAYRHPERMVVFLGDYIDRGPQIRQTLHLVRAMVEAGTAIALMGNHEYNALAWFTLRPGSDIPCRRPTPNRLAQFKASLDALDGEMDEWLEWFSSCPLWLDTPRFRAVHASWDPWARDVIHAAMTRENGAFDAGLVQATSVPGSHAFRAIEHLLKGREIDLPSGTVTRDHHGGQRNRMRIRWFERPEGRGYHEYVLGNSSGLPETPVPDTAVQDLDAYPPDAVPVFFGHYWMRGDVPRLLGPNLACLDWSVTDGGPLVAYRFSGEQALKKAHFEFL
ncbi:MAG: metallophosphoesterase [Phycisphaerales bacterium]|nr:metallophosphoesterase [Phycisphaerales bacterium]